MFFTLFSLDVSFFLIMCHVKHMYLRVDAGGYRCETCHFTFTSLYCFVVHDIKPKCACVGCDCWRKQPKE